MEEESPPILHSPPGPEVIIDGRRYLYFGGTSYLGLAGHPEVIEAACEATRRYGIHTATSRAGFGNNPPTLAVERLAAEFFGVEDAFYFVSGYVGNHIVVQALSRGSDRVFLDEASHYSVREAARLTGAPVRSFRHRDAEDLRQVLRENLTPGERPLVMTDGVFPLTGALAPIREYAQIMRDYSLAAIVVDDAHGFGVLGERGRGTVEHLNLWSTEVNAAPSAQGVGLFHCGTLSKALGGFGGIVAGSREFVQHTRASSHYFDGASAPPAGAAAGSAKALEIVMREPELRARLAENSGRMRAGLRQLGLAVEDWPTPNIGVRIGTAVEMRNIHAMLKERGLLVPYFANYSGAGQEGILRVAVFATHTHEMIDRLLAELRAIL